MALSEESFLPDGEDCAETWRSLRWPDGPKCVECGSSEVAVRTTKYRDHLYRYECEECGRWFTDTSETFVENANVDLPVWVYVIREMDKDRSIHSISQDLSHTYKTVRRLATVIREAIYERRSEWLGPLTGEVEADDVHLKGGQQGRELASGESESEGSTSDGSKESTAGGREARERGLSERGRGSWEGDRPPAVLWVEREGEGGGARVIELRRGVDQRSLFQSAWRHIGPEARIDTDDFSGYGLLGEAYDHRSVDHEETYVTEDGVHCNTAEAEWSVFKPWWNTFRGVAKRNIYHYLSEYSFRRSHREESRQSRLERIVALLYVGGADVYVGGVDGANSKRGGTWGRARVL
jgi:transposase-like protein